MVTEHKELLLILENPDDFYLDHAKIYHRVDGFYIEYAERYPGPSHLWNRYDTLEKCKRFVTRHYGGEGKRTKWRSPELKEK